MDNDLTEQLAERVHAAWAAEKQRQGFADHPFQGEQEGWPCGVMARGRQCDKEDYKHHTDMLPYADLAENVKEYDRSTVRAVLDAIHQAGYLIVPNMTVPV